MALKIQAARRRYIEGRRRWAAEIVWPGLPGQGWLAEVRVASGLSSRDVASRLGVTQSAVAQAEASERAGKIRLDVLRRYAAAIDADVHYVVIPRGSVLLPADSEGRRRRQPLRLRARRRRPVSLVEALGLNDKPGLIASASDATIDQL